MTSTIVPNFVQSGDVTDDEINVQFERARNDINRISSFVNVTLTSAQLLALNATPITVIPAPAAGMAIIPTSVELYKPAGTAYAGIATNEDLALKYTNGSGTQCYSAMETTGFLDQSTAQLRSTRNLLTDFAPTPDAAIVVQMLNGEITTGNTTLSLRINYKTIPATF